MFEGELPLLRRLNISHISQTADNSTCDLDDQLGSAYWPQLEEVVAVGWRHVRLSTILHNFRCPKLKSLHISHLRWEPDLAFTSLQHLSLLEDDDPSCLSLLLSLHLPMLQSLHIQAASTSTLLCSDGRFAHMVIKGKWPQLQSLKLFGHHLDHASVAMLPWADWHCLRWLDLSLNNLDANAIQALMACKLPDLTVLNLSANLLGHSAVQLLVQGQWPRLQHLDLSNNGFGLEELHSDTGGRLACQHLVTAKAWPQLHTLQLEQCYLDVGAFHILFQGNWPKLKLLNLSSNTLPSLPLEVVLRISENHATVCSFSDLLAAWLRNQRQHYGINRICRDYCICMK